MLGMTNRFNLMIEVAPLRMRALSDGGLRVALAKSGSRGDASVVWLAWQPLLYNTVSWTESYGVFAAQTPGRAGELIIPVASRYPAINRAIHSFAGTRFLAAVRDAAVLPGRYDVRNDGKTTLAFGLLQAVTLNTSRLLTPVNLIALPPGCAADFRSQSEIYLWADAGAASATTTAGVPEHAIHIPLTSSITTMSCRYDDLFSVFLSRTSRSGERSR